MKIATNTNDVELAPGITCPWFWSAGWMAQQLRTVPALVILEGVTVLRFTPAALADGVPCYSAEQFERLMQWLTARGDQVLAEAKAQTGAEAVTDE